MYLELFPGKFSKCQLLCIKRSSCISPYSESVFQPPNVVLQLTSSVIQLLQPCRMQSLYAQFHPMLAYGQGIFLGVSVRVFSFWAMVLVLTFVCDHNVSGRTAVHSYFMTFVKSCSKFQTRTATHVTQPRNPLYNILLMRNFSWGQYSSQKYWRLRFSVTHSCFFQGCQGNMAPATPLLSFFCICSCFRIPAAWSTSLSVLHQVRTQRNISSTSYNSTVHSIYLLEATILISASAIHWFLNAINPMKSATPFRGHCLAARAVRFFITLPAQKDKVPKLSAPFFVLLLLIDASTIPVLMCRTGVSLHTTYLDFTNTALHRSPE